MPQLLFLEIYCQSIHWVDDLWIVSVVEIQRIKCVGIGIQKKILFLTLLMPTIISDHLMGRQCRLIPIFNGCRMLGFFLGLFLELDRKYRKQIYKVSYISRNISGIIPDWGNMGLARYREMATLPAGYIPHAKCHRWAAVGYWVSLCVWNVVGWLIVYQLGILPLSCSQYSQTICWRG